MSGGHFDYSNLVVWLLAGIFTLMNYSNQEGVSKTSFILCWISLLAYIGMAIIQ